MYVQYYKLKGRPFGLHPEPRFFFNSKTHKQALSCLGYGLGQKQGFVVITGDSGTGKTVLLSALLHMLSQTQVVTARIINTQLQNEEMLRYVAAELGLPYENLTKVRLLKYIESFLRECQSNGQRVVVIIDEAQNLSDSAVEELRMLLNLAPGDASLQFVLLGQTRLQEHLCTEAFGPVRKRVVASYHLKYFNEEETKAYIIQRLRTVGWEGEPKLSSSAYIAIHDYSNGVPGIINLLCERAFQTAYLDERRQISAEDILNSIDELSHGFSDSDSSGIIVEDADLPNNADVIKTGSLTVEISGVGDAADSTSVEKVELSVKKKSVTTSILFEELSIEPIMIETNDASLDGRIDSEVEAWLKKKKKLTGTSSYRQMDITKKIFNRRKKEKIPSKDSFPPLKDLSFDEFENTVEK